MNVVPDSLEQQILLATSQEEALAPMVAVIKTILQQVPTLLAPHKAMSAAEMHPFDLIIIDVHDNKNSLPLIRSFKERFRDIPVVAMVPYGNVNMVEQVLEQGADDYISQPISLERLKTTLRNALRMRALLAGSVAGMHNGSRHMNGLSPSQGMKIFMDTIGNLKTLREIEDAVIDYTIKSCDGCITQAARLLGVGRSTLYRKMQEKIDSGRLQTSRENQTTRPMMVASSMGDS